MSEPRKLSPILPVAGAVLLLLAGYVGAYYAMVRPVRPAKPLAGMTVGLWYAGPLPQVSERFFAPIHWLDRRIRPDVWELRQPEIDIIRDPDR